MNKISDNQLYRELRSQTSDVEAAELTAFATTLRGVSQPYRSERTHNSNRQAVVDSLAARRSLKLHWPRWQWIAAGTLALVLIILFSIQVPTAVPGDGPTYATKRGIEQLQFALAPTSADKAIVCSRQMKQRANELARLSTTQPQTKTISTLSASILDEAAEFKEYVTTSGTQQPTLVQQRDRDITYTIAALNDASKNIHNSEQQHIITATIHSLQSNT